MVELLSSSLYRRKIDPAFFRVRAVKMRRLMPMCWIVNARSSPAELERVDAIEVIAEELSKHPEFQAKEDLAESELTEATALPREAASRVLDHRFRCRWLEEPPRKDWRRRLYFDAPGSVLIAALRKTAHPEAAVFTDKITTVCAMLANEPELIERPQADRTGKCAADYTLDLE